MSNLKNVVFSADTSKPLEVQICAISGSDGFDKLVEFIKKEYAADISENIEGPDARVCKLIIDGENVELRYEHPYGNSLYAMTVNENSVVKKIGLDLADRLKDL